MSMLLLLNQHVDNTPPPPPLRQTTNDRGVCEQTTVPGCAQTTLAALAKRQFGGLKRHLCHTLELGSYVCRKITSHWQPLFSKKMAAAASFSYKIGSGGLVFPHNWRRQGFGNITGGCSDVVWILVFYSQPND